MKTKSTIRTDAEHLVCKRDSVMVVPLGLEVALALKLVTTNDSTYRCSIPLNPYQAMGIARDLLARASGAWLMTDKPDAERMSRVCRKAADELEVWVGDAGVAENEGSSNGA